MTINELKQMIEEGKITEEQFKVMALAIDPDYKDEDEKKEEAKYMTPDELKKFVQSEVDRATHKIGNENKRLREENEKIKKEHMSETQRIEHEKKLEQEEFERERAEFQIEKRKIYALKAMKAAGLDDGSEKVMDLVEFVLGSDEAEIEANVKTFASLVKKFVADEVDKTFKGAGRTPGKGGSSDNELNPYSKEHWNLTKQWEIESSDPEKAKRLQAAASSSK